MATKGITSIEDSLPNLSVPQVYGNLQAGEHTFAIVVSRFNHELTHELVTQAIACLKEAGVDDGRIVVHWVPGAFEIPVVLSELCEMGVFSVLIALGCVITGETPHAEVINHQIARAISELSVAYRLPIIDTVVGAHTLEQAEARIMNGRESRGWYAAAAALEMVNLMSGMREV